MLRVNVHAGDLTGTSRFNRVAWLDIGYERLAPIADYTTVLYQNGHGASRPAPVIKYPRWSASLWDLTARGLALGLRDVVENYTEEVPVVSRTKKRFAFAEKLCAVIEHIAADTQSRRTLGTLTVSQLGRKRGTYTAVFEEHTMTRHTVEPFDFHPDFLRPAELVLHACLHRLIGKAELPPRPALCVPTPIQEAGREYVPVHRLVEPAKTGFLRWLDHNGVTVTPHTSTKQGMVPMPQYIQFLSEVV